MGPVKLPKHICDALDTLKSRCISNDSIVWGIPSYGSSPGAWGILYKYCKDNNFMKVINALQYGYEPIKTKRQELIDLIELLKCNGESVTESLADAVLEMFNVNGSDPVE